MIRGNKGIDWRSHLEPRDLVYLSERVEPNRWYPMDSFERLGNAILAEVARNDLFSVRLFGRISADPLTELYPNLVAPGDPVESLMRFRVLRSTFFDFEALTIPTLTDDHAEIEISYHMGTIAEEAASYQTWGFFERVVELAGGRSVQGRFLEKSWTGNARTLLELRWENG
jgi:hypothetical protein